jgi:hypothetical protein
MLPLPEGVPRNPPQSADLDLRSGLIFLSIFFPRSRPLLPQIVEVLQDIVVPWQRELKEKRDLLREDPFVGFIALAVLGAVFFYFTRQSPSWIGFLLHYLGLAMSVLGGIAALAAGWFGWGLYRRAAWPTALLVLLIYGCFDTYQVATTTESKPTGSFRIEEGVVRVTTQFDDVKRFTGRPFHRSINMIDQVAGRPVRRISEEGPLNSAGQKHGCWDVTARGTTTNKWYLQDKEVSEMEWQQAGKRS